MTGSFYNRYSSLNCISQKEYRADKWAVHKLIPFSELQRAFSEGVVDRWELAERFAVTEAFMETALPRLPQGGIAEGLTLPTAKAGVFITHGVIPLAFRHGECQD